MTQFDNLLSPECLKEIQGEQDASNAYQELKRNGDFLGFVCHYMNDPDDRLVRNVFWVLTKSSNVEILMLQSIIEDLIDLAIHTENSSVRRLSLHIIERLHIREEDLRTDFLDFCLEHAVRIDELPGIQTLCMKLAYKMCGFYPELMDELKRTIQAMEIDYYKPAVKHLRQKLLAGKM